jgi:tetratricopeptide (TPR) repeat protein
MIRYLIVLRIVSALLLATGIAEAQESTTSTERTAEAYYYYCLGRMDEMELRAQSAIANYEQAVKLDPEAAYPHVALAGLFQRTRRLDDALGSAKKAIEVDPDVAAAHRISGMLYFSMLRSGGDPEVALLAIQAFQEAIRLEPGDVESRSNLSKLLIASRRPDDAAVQLEQLIRFDATAYYEMYLLAQIKQGKGNNEVAIRLLKQSLGVEPRQPEAKEMLVQLLREERHFGEVAEVYQEALVEDPDDVETQIRLADALANDGQLDRSATYFEAALEGDPKNVIAFVGLAMVRRELKQLVAAEELLERALKLEPSHLLGRYTLAGVLEEKRDYEKAIEQWKNLVELPDTGEEAETRKAEYWAHLGFAYGELERSADAIAAFRTAAELLDSERFVTFYIQSLLGAEHHDEAERVLNDARERFPSSRRIQMLETKALDVRGEGEAALEKALALSNEEPENGLLVQGVIEIYRNQKRFTEAVNFLSEKLEASPDNTALLFQLGAMSERQGNYVEAEMYFRKILKKEPDSGAALNYLGYMLADRDQHLEESLGFVQRALQEDPYNGAYLDSLGWVYFKMGELDLAEKNLLKAIESLRLTGVVYDHLGDLYFEKGNLDKAVQFWRRALDQDDDELQRDNVAQKLEEAAPNR